MVIGSVPAGVAAPAAQEVAASELTSAYLYNFVKFTTWPAEALPDGAPIVVCVAASNDWVADSLATLARTTVSGHALSVPRTTLNEGLDSCHVLYEGKISGNRVRELIRATAGLPILTVSDAPDFAERGGVANFFVAGGKLRFSVNPDPVGRARLHISSRLLSLANIVGS